MSYSAVGEGLPSSSTFVTTPGAAGYTMDASSFHHRSDGAHYAADDVNSLPPAGSGDDDDDRSSIADFEALEARIRAEAEREGASELPANGSSSPPPPPGAPPAPSPTGGAGVPSWEDRAAFVASVGSRQAADSSSGGVPAPRSKLVASYFGRKAAGYSETHFNDYDDAEEEEEGEDYGEEKGYDRGGGRRRDGIRERGSQDTTRRPEGVPRSRLPVPEGGSGSGASPLKVSEIRAEAEREEARLESARSALEEVKAEARRERNALRRERDEAEAARGRAERARAEAEAERAELEAARERLERAERAGKRDKRARDVAKAAQAAESRLRAENDGLKATLAQTRGEAAAETKRLSAALDRERSVTRELRARVADLEKALERLERERIDAWERRAELNNTTSTPQPSKKLVEDFAEEETRRVVRAPAPQVRLEHEEEYLEGEDDEEEEEEEEVVEESVGDVSVTPALLWAPAARVDLALLTPPRVPPAPQRQVVSERRGTDGKAETKYSDGSRITRFRNGTEKETRPDGVAIVRFSNGDVKSTIPPGMHPGGGGPESKATEDGAGSIVLYWYDEAQTSHTTYPDGTQVFHFPSGQAEKHLPNEAGKEIRYADGTVKHVDRDGTQESVFPDGTRLVERLDGSTEVIPNSSTPL